MKVYRLASPRHDPRLGWGAARWGGRWNSPGHTVVYMASSLALACLEVLVHIQDTTNMPVYAYWELTVPDWAVIRWNSENNPVLASDSGTVGFGDLWLDNVPRLRAHSSPIERRRIASGVPFLPARVQEAAGHVYLAIVNTYRLPRQPLPVQQVPSLIIPQEWNYLIAPEHVQFGRIKWSDPRPFVFDPRLLHRSNP